MDAKTLAKIVKIVVQEEVTKIVKQEMASLRKQIVAEIKKNNTSRITETVAQDPNGWIDSIDDMDIFDQPIAKSKPQKEYSKNPIINNILNETVANDHDDYDDYPTMGTFNKQSAQGFNASSYREMMAREMGMTTQNSAPVSVNEMLPTTDDRGMPSKVNPDTLPDSLTKALTRDYSQLVKRMNKK